MAHYYENDPNLDTTEFPISFDLNGQRFTLHSSAGVFSKEGLDTGTRILLTWILEHASPVSSVLDLGCGTGVVGVILSHFWKCRITGIDPNRQACHLAQVNYRRYDVNGTVLNQDHLDDQIYEAIVLNPPIRTGKKVMYSLFDQCASHLAAGGHLYIVIRKQHGAQSALEYLNSIDLDAARVFRDKGFWVIQAVKQAVKKEEAENGKDLSEEM